MIVGQGGIVVHRVTLTEGDGIGPEITRATLTVLEATGVQLDWEPMPLCALTQDTHGSMLPEQTLESITKNKVALKGPLTTPIGGGFRSINVSLRKALGLYANIRPVRTLPGVCSRYENVDLVVIRENTEDLYAGVEHMVGEDAAESIRVITRQGSTRIAQFGFEHARHNNRRKVTAVHKANIMKCTDGLWLECCRAVARQYSEIEYEEKIIDNMCMQLVQRPEQYDVLLCPNLYGDILSDLCAGLVGGLGLVPGANMGEGLAVFEPAHGSAPELAGTGRANPLALLFSAVMMLEHLGEQHAAQLVRTAVYEVILEAKHVTPDLGGQATCFDMASAIAKRIRSNRD